jgi:choline dehydrogenase-like flavoprotein
MEQFYDAAVIGGGPAGSTVATALARAGRSVVVFEKEKFPRFHVGESLLPFTLPIFDQLGLSEKIRRAGFQEKYGAFFWNEASGGIRPVVFERSWDDKHPMAYHVKRGEFDELLLRHFRGRRGRARGDGDPRGLFEGGAPSASWLAARRPRTSASARGSSSTPRARPRFSRAGSGPAVSTPN